MNLADILRPLGISRGAAPMPWEIDDDDARAKALEEYWAKPPKERYADPPIDSGVSHARMRGFFALANLAGIVVGGFIAITTFGQMAADTGEAFRRAFTVFGLVWFGFTFVAFVISSAAREQMSNRIRALILIVPLLGSAVGIPLTIYSAFYAPPDPADYGDIEELTYANWASKSWVAAQYWNTPEQEANQHPDYYNRSSYLYACSVSDNDRMKAHIMASEMTTWYVANGGLFGSPDSDGVWRPGTEWWSEYAELRERKEGESTVSPIEIEFPTEGSSGLPVRVYLLDVYARQGDDGRWCVHNIGTPALIYSR